MSILESYKKLTGRGVVSNDTIQTHVVTPTESDYNRGYIARYFAQKATSTNSPILFCVGLVEQRSLKEPTVANITKPCPLSPTKP